MMSPLFRICVGISCHSSSERMTRPELNQVVGELREKWWRYQNCLNRSTQQESIRTILHIFIALLCREHGKRASNVVMISAVRISPRRTAEEMPRINSNKEKNTVFSFSHTLYHLESLGLYKSEFSSIFNLQKALLGKVLSTSYLYYAVFNLHFRRCCCWSYNSQFDACGLTI